MASEEQTSAAAPYWLGPALVLAISWLLVHAYHELHRPLASYQRAAGMVQHPRWRRSTGKNSVWYQEFRLTGHAVPFRLYNDSSELRVDPTAFVSAERVTCVYYDPKADYDLAVQLENDQLGGVVYSLYDTRRGQTRDFVWFLLVLAVAAPLALKPWLSQLFSNDDYS